MKLVNIKVIPNAKSNEVVEEIDSIKVKVNSPAIEGKANKAVIKVLADYFNVKKNQISIVKGEKNRNKCIQIL